MANIKVSQMTEATSFDDGDYTMIVQANQNKKISKENMMSDIPTIQSDISTINTNIGTMTNLATTDKTSLVNATNEIVNSKQYIKGSFLSVSCTHDTLTTLKTIEIPAGTWVIIGQFSYNGTNLRYFLSINKSGSDFSGATSCYDNAGIVVGNVTTIIQVSEPTEILLSLYPNTKTVSVDGYLKAIKYQ